MTGRRTNAPVPWPGDRPGGPKHGLTDQQVRDRTIAGRAAQGLPPTVQSAAGVERIVDILLSPAWDKP